MVRRIRGALLLVLLTLLALPAGAQAHAVLQSTEPLSGATEKRLPEQIVFKFSEPVEGSFGAIRVFDRSGKRVDAGEVFHPGGRGPELATKLESGLEKGSYTATYRVISADSHPVAGGLVFSYGKATATGATVSELLAQQGNVGEVTQVAFGIARGVQYTAIALAVGTVFFLIAVWLPALGLVAGGSSQWREASERFASGARTVLLLAVAAGVLSGIAGIVLQGATAAGVTFWSALDTQILGDVLDTRFGTVWGIRILVWLGLGAVLLGALSPARRPVLRPASVGATGLAPARFGRMALLLLAVPLGFLVISPALSGHASLEKPSAVLVPANAIHVLAMSIWVAGLVLLLFVLPRATRRLEPPDRTRLLAATLTRFSPIAFASVIAILATGLLQSWFQVEKLDNLLDTAFGRSALIKFGLLVGPLMALGAYNQRRLLPRLRRAAEGGDTLGRDGVLLRRSIRTEVALLAVVLGVTAALVSYAPSGSVASGPQSVTASLGPADLQLTVDPARVGPNEMHVYLTDKQTGSQYDRVKEMNVDLVLPEEDLGPLKAETRKAGPGHYVMNGALFGVAGDWEVKVTARVSEFDAYFTTLKVGID
jgi:copper transport protein